MIAEVTARKARVEGTPVSPGTLTVSSSAPSVRLAVSGFIEDGSSSRVSSEVDDPGSPMVIATS